MSPGKAAASFKKLKQKHEKKKISDEAFKRSVDDISVEVKKIKWKVDTEGNWHKYVGIHWVKDNQGFNLIVAPQNLFQLFVLIVKSLITHLPKRMILLGIIAGIAFLIHTYLVIYPNGGYWPGTNKVLDNVLALTTNVKSGVLLWTIASFLIMSLFRRTLSLGPKKMIAGFYTGPKRVYNAIKNKRKSFITSFAMFSVLLLIISQFLLKNEAIAYTLMIGAVLAVVTFRADITYMVLRLGYQDLAKFLKFKKNKFDDIYFDSFQLALIFAMLLNVLLQKRPMVIYITVGILAALFIYSKLKKNNKVAKNVVMLGICVFNIYLLYSMKVYADDGGVVEAGGFGNWFNSPGAFTAVTIGLPPAIGAGLGGLIGLVTSGVDFIDTFVSEGLEDLEDALEEGADIAVDTLDGMAEDISDGIDDVGDALAEGADIAVDTIDGMAEDISDGIDDVGDALAEGADIAVDTLDGMAEDISDGIEVVGDALAEGADIAIDTLDGMADDISDGVEVVGDALVEGATIAGDTISGITSDVLDIAEETAVAAVSIGATMAETLTGTASVLEDLATVMYGNDPGDKLDSFIDLAETAWELPGIIGDKLSDGQQFVFTSTLSDALFNAFESIVPESFIKATEIKANNLFSSMGAVKELLTLGEFIPKDHPMSGLLGHAGVVKDALDNFGLGDNPLYATIKSLVTNKIKGSITEANPAVAIMDSLSTLLIGGSEADKIINPGQTIGGSINLLIDTMADAYNGTDDVASRIDTGKYGGAIKIADETSELIAEAVYNTDQFAEDFNNVMTSDDFYDGMYDSNAALWRPAEGSWAIKRGACYVGETVTEGFIKIGDGVREMSSWLGDKFGG